LPEALSGVVLVEVFLVIAKVFRLP